MGNCKQYCQIKLLAYNISQNKNQYLVYSRDVIKSFKKKKKEKEKGRKKALLQQFTLTFIIRTKPKDDLYKASRNSFKSISLV